MCPRCRAANAFSITISRLSCWFSVTILIVVPPRDGLLQNILRHGECMAGRTAIHVDLAQLSEIMLSLLFHSVFGCVMLTAGFFVIFLLGSGRPVS